jgi:hypothetical protein
VGEADRERQIGRGRLGEADWERQSGRDKVGEAGWERSLQPSNTRTFCGRIAI